MYVQRLCGGNQTRFQSAYINYALNCYRQPVPKISRVITTHTLQLQHRVRPQKAFFIESLSLADVNKYRRPSVSVGNNKKKKNK